MVGIDDIVEITFGLIYEIFEFLRFALRIIREETLAPKTFAPHRKSAELGAQLHAETAETGGISSPYTAGTQMRLVVVAELVALSDGSCMTVLVIIIHIVLRHDRIAEVTLCEFIDIHIVVAAEQVLHLVVVPRAVDADVGSGRQTGVILIDSADLRGEVPVQLVGMALLDDIVRTGAGTVYRFILGIAEIHVGLVHFVPVEVADITHVAHPLIRQTGRSHRSGLQVGSVQQLVARHIAVIIGTGVCTVVPRQRRITVLTETERSGQVELGMLIGIERIVDHSDRLVAVTHARITHLAVLVAPVGVVIVVADQIVSLLRGSLLRTALGGSTHNREAQPVTRIENLLGRSEISVGVVIDAVHVGVAALTGRYRQRIGPAVVQQTRTIGHHGTEAIHRIGVHQTHAKSLAHLRSTGVDVGRTADATHAVIRHDRTVGDLLVARSVVQTAPQRPGRIARHSVVEANTVQVNVRILRIVTTHVETHLAEPEGSDVVKNVLRSRKGRRQRLRIVAALGVELCEDRIVHYGRKHFGDQNHRIDVAHHLVHAHHERQRLEFGSLELQRIFAGLDILDHETTSAVGRGSHFTGSDRNLHPVHRDTSLAGNDLTLDTAALSERGQRHQGKYKN